MAGYTKRYNWFRDRQLLVLTSMILMAILPSILPEISAKLQAKRKVYKSTYRSSKLQIPITHVPVHPGKSYNWSKTSKQHCLGYSKIYYFSSPKDTQISIKFNKFHMKYPHLDYMTAYMGGIPVLKNRTLVDFKPFYSRVKQFPILFSSKDHYRTKTSDSRNKGVLESGLKSGSKSGSKSNSKDKSLNFHQKPSKTKDIHVFTGKTPNVWSEDEHELISIGDEYTSDANSLIVLFVHRRFGQEFQAKVTSKRIKRYQTQISPGVGSPVKMSRPDETKRKSAVLCNSKNKNNNPKPPYSPDYNNQVMTIKGANSGSITSHSEFPHNSVPGNQNCNIVLKSNSPITLNLITISMGGQNLMKQNCDDSYLMVVDNANNVSKKFCTKNDYGVKSKSTGFHMRYETDRVRNKTLSNPNTCNPGERWSPRYNKCKIKKCKCRHGVPAIGAECPRHRFHRCTQCRQFFKLDSNGHCMGCEPGKHFSKKGGCVKNKCKCRHGDASQDCPKHRFRYCTNCDRGYEMKKKGTRKYCRLKKRPLPDVFSKNKHLDRMVNVVTPSVGFITSDQNEVICESGTEIKFKHKCLKLKKTMDIKRYLCIRKKRPSQACKKKLGPYSAYFGDMSNLTKTSLQKPVYIESILEGLYAIGTTCKSGDEPYVICQCKGPGEYRYYIEESSTIGGELMEARCRRD